MGGGVKSSSKIVIRFLDYAEQNDILKFLSVDFGKKSAWKGAWLPSNIFGHLKRALELLISDQMSPQLILWDNGLNTITPCKKKTFIIDHSSGKKKCKLCIQKLEAPTA